MWPELDTVSKTLVLRLLEYRTSYAIAVTGREGLRYLLEYRAVDRFQKRSSVDSYGVG
jgi:hypothetical protein